MNLVELGWNDSLAQVFQSLALPSCLPARVSCEHNHIYEVLTENDTLAAEAAGKLRHNARGAKDLPAVGDWVALHVDPSGGRARIEVVLPRKSAFLRKTAGSRTEEQVVAANVDVVFLVSGLDGDFNPRRIERYLTMAWDSGATPIIVLNKADLCEDVHAHIEIVEASAMGVPVLGVSAAANQGMNALRAHIGPGKTAAFLGSSGVGKSSLINCLLNTERQEVRAVREDDSHGRHTTTYRELIPLPGGGLVMDTPGMRELQLWTDEAGLNRSFEDIEELAAFCRFGDCSHEKEPGCAVQQAIKDGTLDAARWRAYQKLKRELEYLSARQEGKVRLAEKTRWRKIHMEARRMNKNR